MLRFSQNKSVFALVKLKIPIAIDLDLRNKALHDASYCRCSGSELHFHDLVFQVLRLEEISQGRREI
jgi:hypothetical protein